MCFVDLHFGLFSTQTSPLSLDMHDFKLASVSEAYEVINKALSSKDPPLFGLETPHGILELKFWYILYHEEHHLFPF